MLIAGLLGLMSWFSPAGGRAWFYHPLDGTYVYETCRTELNFSNATDDFRLTKLKIRCDQGPWFLFEQAHEGVTLQKKGSSLIHGDRVVGEFGSDFVRFTTTDTWDAENFVQLKGLAGGTPSLQWYVSSSDYQSFDVLADGFETDSTQGRSTFSTP